MGELSDGDVGDIRAVLFIRDDRDYLCACLHLDLEDDDLEDSASYLVLRSA